MFRHLLHDVDIFSLQNHVLKRKWKLLGMAFNSVVLCKNTLITVCDILCEIMIFHLQFQSKKRLVAVPLELRPAEVIKKLPSAAKGRKEVGCDVGLWTKPMM